MSMKSLKKKILKMPAVWWEIQGFNDQGQPKFLSPIEIKCRWEDVQEQFLDANGEEQVSNARVFVDRAMEVGDYLRKGTLDEIMEFTTPTDNTGVYAIRKFNEIPDFKCKVFFQTAIL